MSVLVKICSFVVAVLVKICSFVVAMVVVVPIVVLVAEDTPRLPTQSIRCGRDRVLGAGKAVVAGRARGENR